MRPLRRRWTLLTLTLCLTLPACTPRGTAERPPPSPAAAPTTEAPSTLRVAIDEPDGLLPARADEPAEQWIADAVFDGLTRWGDDLRPEPAAAVSWTADASQTLWTFRLRPDATWHDGQPVVAGDFVRAWRAVVRERRLAHLLFDVEGVPEAAAGSGTGEDPFARALPAVRAVDARTLEVRLRRPHAGFAAVVAHPALAPLPVQAEDPAFAGRPVGNGPFAMSEEWSPGRFVRARRFPAWRNGRAPAVEEILFQVMDPETAYLALQQGRLHVAPVPAGALRQVAGRAAPVMWRGQRAALYLLGMDHTRPPFSSLAVRRALSHAVNRVTLAAQVAEGATVPATGLLPGWLPEAVAERCGSCERDLAAARAAFAAAGVRTLTLSFNAGAGHEAVARRLRADLAQAGVDLEADAREPEDFFAAGRAGELTLFRLGWQLDVPGADALLRPLLHGGAVPAGAGDTEGLRQNWGRYRAADVDALLDRARATASEPVRAAFYRQAARLALERDQAVVPLFAYRHRLARARGVSGLAPDPLGQVDWTEVTVRPPDGPA